MRCLCFSLLPIIQNLNCTYATSLHSIYRCILSSSKRYSTQDVYASNVKIGALSRAGRIRAARQLFDNMPTRDVVSWNSLLTAYWQNGIFDESRRLFELMPERNVVSWNSMIAGCCDNELIDEALLYFRRMPHRNVASYNAMISGFVKCGRVGEAAQLFEEMPRRNVISYTATIDGFLKKGMVDRARALFDSIPRKNDVTWTVMISGYIENAEFDKARELFEQMPSKNVVATTAMITGSCKEGKMEDARVLFDKLEHKDHVAWNALITGYSQNGNGEEALKLMSEMLKMGLRPDNTTIVMALTACSSLASLNEGRQTHTLIIKYGFQSHLSICNALVSVYNKAGSILDSEVAFGEICQPDLVSWNTIIAAYAQHGLYDKACELFGQMGSNGFQPDGITFLSLLSACGHAGRVNDSMTLFDAMTKDYNIVPRSEHYACLVDILSRAGQLEKAYKVIREMPFEGDCAVWGALLSACHACSNVDVGELAAKKLLELEPQNAVAYVMLSNLYAASTKWKDVTRVRFLMKEHGVKKQSAFSWTEIGDKVHIFVGGGVSHPDIGKICLLLKQISMQMKANVDSTDSHSELMYYG